MYWSVFLLAFPHGQMRYLPVNRMERARRGVTSGGPVRPTNEFQRYPRFRLLDLSSSHPLMDMKFTSIVGCEECDEAAIKSKYDFEPNGAKKPEVYANGFKYLLVIDGNGYSGRMLSLMRSNSLVFKSTIFTEFFTNWMIPVRPSFLCLTPSSGRNRILAMLRSALTNSIF